MIKKLLTLTLLLYSNTTYVAAQQAHSLSYTRQISRYDLAPLWRNTRLHFPESNQQWDTFPEPLGFIGNNYQRFYIHYTSVVKDKANPSRYYVQGKTRVKANVCRFTGTITVLKAALHKKNNPEYPKYPEGEVACQVDFQEDRNQPGSGHIAGKLVTYWFLDKQNQIKYNTLDAVSDGFANNQCTATWTSNHGGPAKTCNWGDFRIPESGGLDVGAGEFSVAPKYTNNGWQDYNEATTAGEENKPGGKALAEEKRKWWQ